MPVNSPGAGSGSTAVDVTLPSGSTSMLKADEAGDLLVGIGRPLGAFGELRTATVNPVVQIDGILGVRGDIEQLTATGGSVTAEDGMVRVRTGTSIGGYGVARSLRGVRYRPGQSMLYRMTALFPAPGVANSLLVAGPFNSTSGLFVGYGKPGSESEFGVMHRTGGAHEIRTLTITGTGSGSETITWTLRSTAYNIPTTETTPEGIANEIEEWMMANQSAWSVEAVGGVVTAYFLNVGPGTGTYSTSTTGTAGVADARVADGVANTETWVLASEFNEDPLDGTGPSGLEIGTTIDLTKGHVFEFDLQYLGFGDCEVRMENPNTGRFFAIHRFKFAGARTVPTLTTPVLKPGWVAASLRSTTDLSVYGASAMGGTEGNIHPLRNPEAIQNSQSIGSSNEECILGLRVSKTFNGKIQLFELLPKLLDISNDGGKTVRIRVLANPTIDTSVVRPQWQYVNAGESIVEYMTQACRVSADGQVVGAFSVAGNSNGRLGATDISDANDVLHLSRGDVLLVMGELTTGSASTVTASMIVVEE